LFDRFWHRIVTCNEKWIIFVNPNRKTQWVLKDRKPQPRIPHDRFGKKVLLSVWWNFEGVLHFEMVSENRAVNADLYYQQQDNTPCHHAVQTQLKLQEMDGVEILPHPVYSPVVAP
jgi:histone-lysine N-methyltransferase SETMAR